MNAKSATVMIALMVTSFTGNAALADTICDVIDAGPLKKLGAQKLAFCFADPKGEQPQATWLQGMKGDAVLWKKPVPLKVAVNTAKTDVICRKGRIEVLSQFPGTAAYTSQTFIWDGNKISFVSKKDGDASQEQVDKLMKLAVSGTRDQLDDFADQEHVIFYPANYINSDNVKAILTAGRKVALALASAHKPQLALQRMQTCLEASMDLVYLEGDGGSKTAEPDKWIEAWSDDRIALSSKDWIPFLSDYAKLLREAGKTKQAATIAKVVHANTADVAHH